MSQGLQLARPVMRRSAGLDPDQARRQLLEERQNAAPPQLTADNHLALRINAMDLKHRLGDVETDSRNRLHVGSSETWVLNCHGTPVPVEEPSTASYPDMCSFSRSGEIRLDPLTRHRIAREGAVYWNGARMVRS